MDDSNKQEFAVLFYGTGELYDKSVTKNLLQLYFSALKEYSITDIQSGINKHILDPKHGSFFPKPADIVRHLQSANIPTEDKALLAWNQIVREIRVTGAYGSLQLDDKQALAAIKAVKSWKDLCLMPESSLTWAKKEFIANYKVYENTPLELLPSSLPGLEELENHKKNNSTGAIGLADVFKRIEKQREV